MIREQAVIKLPGDSEVPVIALDEPLVWIVVLLGFFLAFLWIRTR